jgi:mRNA-degrading endonuclease YafQ of YafQ-DinJ toxin-antitoxin module
LIASRFERKFVKALKKHASIKNEVRRKVDMIIADPVAMGEPLQGDRRGFYSCPVKRHFIIVYLYCEACRKKGDSAHVACSDCLDTPNQTIKFILLAPHDEAYRKQG